MYSFTRSLFAALLALWLAVSAFGQSANPTTGGISGTVADSTGGALPGVTVTVTNTQTGLSRNSVTDNEGRYSVVLLPPGTYRVEAELAGLGTARRPSVSVLLGNTTAVNLVINPQLSEQITVTAAAPVVDVTRSGLASSVTETEIESLPILGRDFRDLARLTPGAANTFGDRVAFNGARGITTDVNIDGADTNSDFFGEQRGGTRAPFTFSQAAIREFQVIRSAFSAEYSKGVGGTLNAVTKSGTNDFTGQAFYYMRSADWAASRATTLEGRPVSDAFQARDVDQYGAAVGGPIVRDRLFYFVNADMQDFSRELNVFDFRTDPDWAALPAETRTAFITRVEQLIGGSIDDEFNFSTAEDQKTYLLKLDLNAGDKHHISFRDNLSSFTNFASEGTRSLSNQGVFENNFNSAVLQGESVLTSSLFNQAIIQYSNEERPRSPVNTSVPHTQINGVVAYQFGQADFLPSDLIEERFQLKDTLSWQLGQHTVKTGFEVINTELDNLFPRDYAGHYIYSSIPDFLSGRVNEFQQGLGPEGLERGNNVFDYRYTGFFVHDTWQRRNLTLDFGVRYDYQTVPQPINNITLNSARPRPELVENFQEDTDNIAPRFGFAYDVRGNGRSVVRGGVGRYYQFLPSILLADPLAQIAGLYTTISVRCSATLVCPTYPNLYNRADFNRFAQSTRDVRTVSPDLEAQESTRAIVGFEQQIGTSYSVGIEGTWSQFEKQQGLININAVPTGLSFGNLPQYNVTSANRPYPEFQNVTQHVSDAEASYRALTLSTRKLNTGTSPFTWLAHYTWSRAIDQDSNERTTSTSFRLDPFNPELGEGPADYDVTHNFVLSGTYRAPLGIDVAGILNWRSGIPYSRTINGLGNGLGSISVFTPVFVNGNGDVVDLTQATGKNNAELAQFLNGTRMEGRNAHRQPDYFSVDLRVGRRFNFAGDFGLEVLGEVFNLLNTENTAVPGPNMSLFTARQSTAGVWTFTRNEDFGKATSFNAISDPRQYQIALKLHF
jgi:hypothetical protein